MEISNAFEGIAPPSTSASKRVPYEVYINHRGPDTKETLASPIYNTLRGMGLKVFLDAEELEPGDFRPAQIEEAIVSSFLHIAIISPRYAESPWCLAELSLMLKTGSTIIPVFYMVKPSDVSYVKGPFADAFEKHEMKGRYSSEKLDEWKMALHKVSLLFGQVVKDDDDKGRLLKSIVNYVIKQIKKEVQLVVAKHPVGLDEIVHDFERSVLDSSQKVQIVGIAGIEGSGKTTLAKEIYNRKCSSIDKHSFVSDVRDAAYKNVLHKKQKMLMEDLGLKEFQFDHVQSLQVLIILDDVDNPEQLDALLPRIDSLKEGSLIIVTSRESDVLKSHRISSIYQMKRLNLKNATELLCWHAFLQPFPPNEFQHLVEKFVEICRGSPLSLRVFGGLLYKQPKDYWYSQLNKVSRLLPDDHEIKERIKINFDALNEKEQEIFLDIACFFIGEEKSLAIAVWDGSGWSGEDIWEVLFNEGLVEVDEHNRIRMHDHLRDLGKEIAQGRSPYRVWSMQQVADIQKQATERVLIRGIKAVTDDFYEECSSYQRTPFEECMELVRGCSTRFKRLTASILVVKENYLTEELATVLPGLVWLRWVNFSEKALPWWLLLKNLRVLELHDAQFIEELWSDTADPPLQLRELRITQCSRVQRFPVSIARLQHLKKIILDFGFGGSSLPDEFCNLQSLEHLELTCCPMLSSLPHRFGDLRNLRYLDLSCCLKLKLRFDMLENITKLEYLALTRCHELDELPRQISNQTSLTRLFAEGTSIRNVPTEIGELRRLEELRIGGPMLTSLPSSLGNLSSLKSLVIDGCPQLKYLPQSLCHLDLLEQVRIRASGLRELPFWARPSITENRLQTIWNALQSLWIGHRITEHESLQTYLPNKLLASLKTLSLVANPQLMEIQILPQSLTILEICVCKMLKNMSGISGLVNLRKLEICSCPELDELPSFADLASLQEFKIQGCPKVEIIQGLEHCTSLQVLTAEVPLILACDTISAFKPCILSTKTYPWEMMIRGRVIHIVEPVVDSLSLANLTVLRLEEDSDWDKITQDLFNTSFLWYEEENESNKEESGSSGLNTSVGKVVHIAVCRNGSSAFPEYCFGRRFGSNPNKQRKAMLATGEDERVVAVFRELIELLT